MRLASLLIVGLIAWSGACSRTEYLESFRSDHPEWNATGFPVGGETLEELFAGLHFLAGWQDNGFPDELRVARWDGSTWAANVTDKLQARRLELQVGEAYLVTGFRGCPKRRVRWPIWYLVVDNELISFQHAHCWDHEGGRIVFQAMAMRAESQAWERAISDQRRILEKTQEAVCVEALQYEWGLAYLRARRLADARANLINRGAFGEPTAWCRRTTQVLGASLTTEILARERYGWPKVK